MFGKGVIEISTVTEVRLHKTLVLYKYFGVWNDCHVNIFAFTLNIKAMKQYKRQPEKNEQSSGLRNITELSNSLFLWQLYEMNGLSWCIAKYSFLKNKCLLIIMAIKGTQGMGVCSWNIWLKFPWDFISFQNCISNPL